MLRHRAEAVVSPSLFTVGVCAIFQTFAHVRAAAAFVFALRLVVMPHTVRATERATDGAVQVGTESCAHVAVLILEVAQTTGVQASPRR